MDLQHLRASDGTGEAVLAHVQTVRTPGSTVLDLDNVDNWNTKAIVITGTPAANGFISPTGMKVMYGHLNAGDFIIDGYAPGYVDNGNTTAEVAIVKMTTSWADALVDLLKQTLGDNGKIKTDGIDSDLMFTDNVDPVKRTSELMFDHVATGAILAGLGYGSLLTVSLSAGTAYINGYRQLIAAVASRAYTASKDTYVDALYNASGTATIVYTEVANNAASPALAANSIRLGIVVSGANIAAATSINQGQTDRILPIVSSTPYAVVDSLGNLIYPRDPMRKMVGYRQITTTFGTAGQAAITGLSFPINVTPQMVGRKIKLELIPYADTAASGSYAELRIFSGATLGALTTQIGATQFGFISGGGFPGSAKGYITPTVAGVIFITGSLLAAAGTANVYAGTTQPTSLEASI